MYANYGITQFATQEPKYETIIASMADTYGVDENLIKAVIATESSWVETARRAEPAKNDASIGLMQVLLGTAKDVLGNSNLTEAQLFTPYTNIQAGTAYIARQTAKYKTPSDIYAAYNAGSVRKLANGNYVNQSNVDNFMKWYNLYAPGAVPVVVPQAVNIPSSDISPTILYAGIGAGIALLIGVIYFASRKRS